MNAAERAGKTGDALQAVEDEWTAKAGLCLFADAVVDFMAKNGKSEQVQKEFRDAAAWLAALRSGTS